MSGQAWSPDGRRLAALFGHHDGESRQFVTDSLGIWTRDGIEFHVPDRVNIEVLSGLFQSRGGTVTITREATRFTTDWDDSRYTISLRVLS